MEGDCGENSNLGLGENAIYFLRLLTPGAGSWCWYTYIAQSGQAQLNAPFKKGQLSPLALELGC